jgi:thiol:disulfide interchange protein DsbA
MQSFATDAKLTRARQFMIASGVDSTPTLIVNGKYRVTTKKSFQDMLRVADLLIARERAAGAGQ